MVTPLSLSPWYDVADTLEGVRGKLRLQIGDVDEDRLGALIPAAAHLIDVELDRCDMLTGPPPHPLIQWSLEHVTIRLYLDTPTSQLEGTTILSGFADPLAEIRPQLLPFKQRWGVG
jgi:hypothetical protein